ncbi:neuroglian-like isoform X2 [Haliotis rufescens]|uniref:neuroglian-like isoform X2 n=1 Tax=Haliotis rufescens TaxID=6454 RepID=UPI00201EA281|nr:neuroglian-like isoform X2 [Haliotis rufescens]
METGRAWPMLLLMLHWGVHTAADELPLPPVVANMSPKKRHFVEGERLKLPCEAQGQPIPVLYWLKSGVNIDYNSDINKGRVVVTKSNTLVIHDAQATDAGYYQCRAENIHGISLSNKYELIEAKAESGRTSQVRARRLVPGRSLKLRCNPPRSVPNARIVWSYQYDYDYEDEQEFVELSETVVTDYEGDLYFVSVREDEIKGDAEYACVAYNQITRSMTYGNSFRLKLQGGKPVDEPMSLMWQTPAAMLGLQGKTLKMMCIFGGNPRPQVSWSRADGSMLNLTRSKFGPGNHEIRIEKLEEADTGVYMCTGSQQGTRPLTRTFTVDVEAAPTWVTEPKDVTADEGEDVVIDCRAAGTPSPHIEWLINGIPLREREPKENQRITEGKLVLTDVRRTDTMAVQCNASNIHGYVWSDTYINILAIPAVINEPEHADVKVIRGGRALLHCHHTGHPVPDLVWFKGEKKLYADGRYELFENGSLLIGKAMMRDGGLFKCFVRNKYGEDNSKYTVIIRDPTRIVHGPKDVSVRTGQDAVMECKAATDPAEVNNLRYEWKKDNTTLDFTNPQLNRQNGRLVITKVALADTAVYKCVATNGIDSVVATARLLVQAPPGEPSKVTLLRCDGDSATIAWKFNTSLTNHSPLKRFFVEYSTDYDPGNWYKMKTVGANKRQAKVELSPFGSYTFRVKAVNEIGPGLPSAPTMNMCETPENRPPFHPKKVHTVTDTTNVLAVEWEPMAPIQHNGPGFHYVVMISKVGDNTVQSYIRNDSFKGRFDIPVDDVYQPYTVTVKAANRVGEPPQLATSHMGYSGEGVPLVFPENLTLSDFSRLGEGQAELSWVGVEDDPELIRGMLRGYMIRYWKSGDPDNVFETLIPLESTEISGTQTVVRNLPMYSDLQADVTVVNTHFKSIGSNVVNFSTPEGVPDPPQYINVLHRGAIHFLVDWGRPENTNGILTGYKVGYRLMNSTHTGDMMVLPETTRRRSFIKDLQPNTEYRVYVWALTMKGPGDPIYMDAKTAKKNTAITKPQILDMEPTDRAVEITWALKNSSNTRAAAYYLLQHKLLGTNAWTRGAKVEGNRFSQSVYGLHPQSTYQARVVALDSGQRAVSDTELFNTAEREHEYDHETDYGSGNGTGDDEDMATQDTVTRNIVFVTESTHPKTPMHSTTPMQGLSTERAETTDKEYTTTMMYASETGSPSTSSVSTTKVVDIDIGSKDSTEPGIVLPDVTGVSESGDIIYTVVKNEAPLDLICRMKGYRSRVKWYKDDVSVLRSSDNIIMVDHHRLTDARLIILKPRVGDAGMYKCVVQRNNPSKGQFFQVTLKKDAKEEKSCAVSGNDASRIQWNIIVCVLCLVFRSLTLFVSS